MPWIVAYDVSEDRQRTRLGRQLFAAGIRLQKSVFLVEASRRTVHDLVASAGDALDQHTDLLGAWPLARTWRRNQIVAPASARPLEERFIVL